MERRRQAKWAKELRSDRCHYKAQKRKTTKLPVTEAAPGDHMGGSIHLARSMSGQVRLEACRAPDTLECLCHRT